MRRARTPRGGGAAPAGAAAASSAPSASADRAPRACPASQVLQMLQEVASARRVALLELTDNGFLEKEKARRVQKRQQRMAEAGGDVDELRGADKVAEPLRPVTPADTADVKTLALRDGAKDSTTGGMVSAGGTGGRPGGMGGRAEKKLQKRKREHHRVAKGNTAVEVPGHKS